MTRKAFTSVVIMNYLYNSIQVSIDAALSPLIMGREIDTSLSN